MDRGHGKRRARPRSAEDVVTLFLTHTNVTDDGLKELAPFKNLEEIYLNNQGLYTIESDMTNEGLKELARFKKLRQVHFGHLTVVGLKHLAALKSLAVLDLTEAHLQDADLKLLGPLKTYLLEPGGNDNGCRAPGVADAQEVGQAQSDPDQGDRRGHERIGPI